MGRKNKKEIQKIEQIAVAKGVGKIIFKPSFPISDLLGFGKIAEEIRKMKPQ